jgi:hypothetical protein
MGSPTVTTAANVHSAYNGSATARATTRTCGEAAFPFAAALVVGRLKATSAASGGIARASLLTYARAGWLIKAASGAMATWRVSGASRATPWAPFALLASPAEEASLFAEGGMPKLVFTQSALQKATLDKAFVNERFVRRAWEARRFADLDAETREAVPPVVLVDAPDGARQRVLKPDRAFEAINSVRFASPHGRDASGKGGDAFVCAFCAFVNTALATLCAAADVRLLCAPVFDESVGKDAPVAAAYEERDGITCVAVLRVTHGGTPGGAGWACAVARGGAVQAVLAFGVGVGSAATVSSSVDAFYAPLGIHITSAADIELHADSTPEDACARACAAAWTAACFRDQEFVSIWQQTQWSSDGFVAGATRCEEAARMALAHAVVGCSSSLAKSLAARKLLAEAIHFETKVRRVKLAAVEHETDARRLFMADQMEQADARRVAMASLPDDFPLLKYPHNGAHHMYLWSPNLH